MLIRGSMSTYCMRINSCVDKLGFLENTEGGRHFHANSKLPSMYDRLGYMHTDSTGQQEVAKLTLHVLVS